MTIWGASNELYHHGIKGQKKGFRRFQNEDGSLTEEGRRRYGYYDSKDSRSGEKKRRLAYKELAKQQNRIDKSYNKADKKLQAYERALKDSKTDTERANMRYMRDNWSYSRNALMTASVVNKKAMNKSLKELKLNDKEIASLEQGRSYIERLK